ncbi:MAG TPA: GtrA family protein [Micromonosporaceae bacterium]
MRVLRFLPARWQKLTQEVLKFGAVGGINTLLNYAVFNVLVLTVFVGGELKATVIAALVATCSSYLMNRYWTYRDRPRRAMRHESILFFLLNTVGLVIELGVLGLVKYGFGITNLLMLNVAKTAGLTLATAFRFWSYRTWVFKPAEPDTAPATVPQAEYARADEPPRPADKIDTTVGAGWAIGLEIGERPVATR